MEVVATAKWVRTTARKARLVTASVEGLPVAEALVILRFMPRAAARDVANVIKSAAANAEHNYNLDDLHAARCARRGGGGGDHQALPAQAARHGGQHLQAHRPPARLRHRRRAGTAETATVGGAHASHGGDRSVSGPRPRDAGDKPSPRGSRCSRRRRRGCATATSPAFHKKTDGAAAVTEQPIDTAEETASPGAIEEPATDTGKGDTQ